MCWVWTQHTFIQTHKATPQKMPDFFYRYIPKQKKTNHTRNNEINVNNHPTPGTFRPLFDKVGTEIWYVDYTHK